MRLTEHVWLVGSGAMGFSITESHDCHVYLVSDGSEAVLIDTGAGVEPDAVLSQIARCEVPASAIHSIVLTHAHADHAGGAAALSSAIDARVCASPQVAEILRAGDAEQSSYLTMKAPGGYPEDYEYASCAVDLELSADEVLTVRQLELQVIASPGHSTGHLAYLLRRPDGIDLFCGDAAFALGRILLQDIWDCSLQDSTATVRRFAALRPDGLYPGHGAIAVQRGWEHLYSAFAEIEAGLPPRQLTF